MQLTMEYFTMWQSRHLPYELTLTHATFSYGKVEAENTYVQTQAQVQTQITL